ncbi:MAG: cyclic nucleotide-binding domain-containing protein, partial [Pseudomonadota bacterium]
RATGIGGAEMPPVAHERIAFLRAAIKRPDILVLDSALISHEAADRQRTRDKLRMLLPETTLIYLENEIRDPRRYDLFFEIVEGRIDGAVSAPATAQQDGTSEPALTGRMRQDLDKKIRKLEMVEVFRRLDRSQLRLLAFASTWFTAEPGERLFTTGEIADAAYVVVDGSAHLQWSDTEPGSDPVTVVNPGRLIGDLAVITNERRRLDLVAAERVKGLRLGADELRAIVESDAEVAASLLRTVAGYLHTAGDRLHALEGERRAELSGAC